MKELIELVPFTNKIYITDLEDCSFCIPPIRQLKAETKSVKISNKGGWQSPGYNYNSHEFLKPVLDSIKKFVSAIYENEHVDSDADLLNYWFNINNKHNYNIAHRHGESYYSAVLYLRTPEGCGNLVFDRPDDAHSWINYKNYTDGNWGSYWITPVPNRLIIFPAYMPHYVEQNLTEEIDDERISIALNFK